MRKIVLLCVFLFIYTFTFGRIYGFDRYVSGEYFDTYFIECDDINIDLQDFTTQCDLFYIPPIEGNDSPCGSQNIGNNQWRQFYKDVRVVPKEDLYLDSFTFITHDNWQSFGFTFSLEGTTIYCDKFLLDNYNYRDYFKMDCYAAISSSAGVTMRFQGKTPTIQGVISSPHITLTNGNNTPIEIGECGFLHTDTLTLIQSSQNPVLIDGHVIVGRLDTDANLTLQWDDAVVTIGELPVGVKIFGGDNTTINLCKNPSTGADNLGYFTGTVMFNTEPTTGWVTTPSAEGDINLNDNSGDYWMWFHKNSTATEIGIYDDFNSCMEEFISIEQFISPSSESPVKSQKNVVKSNVSVQGITPIGQKFNTKGKCPVFYFQKD